MYAKKHKFTSRHNSTDTCNKAILVTLVLLLLKSYNHSTVPY